jgi:holo-[acyl-carrier protein] synthase
MMIISVGTDLVSVPRFKQAAARTEGFLDRVFTPSELTLTNGEPRPIISLAGIFAAKESIAKALGAPDGLSWQDCQIDYLESGKPEIVLFGKIAAIAADMRINKWHLSISHDAELAVAFVVAEAL